MQRETSRCQTRLAVAFLLQGHRVGHVGILHESRLLEVNKTTLEYTGGRLPDLVLLFHSD